MLAQMHICMYVYVWIVYGHIQTYRFCLGEFSRCCHKHVQALRERKGRSGWTWQRLHKLASLPGRLSSDCAQTLKHSCGERGGDPARAFSPPQRFDGRRIKVSISERTGPQKTNTTPEQSCLRKTTSAQRQGPVKEVSMCVPRQHSYRNQLTCPEGKVQHTGQVPRERLLSQRRCQD